MLQKLLSLFWDLSLNFYCGWFPSLTPPFLSGSSLIFFPWILSKFPHFCGPFYFLLSCKEDKDRSIKKNEKALEREICFPWTSSPQVCPLCLSASFACCRPKMLHLRTTNNVWEPTDPIWQIMGCQMGWGAYSMGAFKSMGWFRTSLENPKNMCVPWSKPWAAADKTKNVSYERLREVLRTPERNGQQ